MMVVARHIITKFEARDGSQWDDEEKAIERDELCAFVDEAMYEMGGHPGLSDHQYIQHDPPTVIACRVRILRLCAKKWPTEKVFQHKPPEDVHPFSYAGRYLDDAGGPLKKAWDRFMQTDDRGREWSQPYFVTHPSDDAQEVRLNKAQ